MPILLEIAGVEISAPARFLFSNYSYDDGKKSYFTIDKGRLVLNNLEEDIPEG